MLTNQSLQCVAEAIRDNYNISLDSAEAIVESSFVSKLYDKCRDVIEHYDDEYWADEIMSSYNVNA